MVNLVKLPTLQSVQPQPLQVERGPSELPNTLAQKKIALDHLVVYSITLKLKIPLKGKGVFICQKNKVAFHLLSIFSFNFPTSATSGTTTGSTWTHLANQHYDVCIRRASGYCYICYTPLQTTQPVSFGVS